MPPFDSTLPLRADPYRFIRRTCDAVGSDAFETRLMLERTLCLTGVEAARFFYDRDIFTRAGAAPRFLRRTLFGEGGVQGLDGAVHEHRKGLFLALMGPGRTDALTERAVAGIARRLEEPGEIVLQDAFERILTRAVCDWAGVPLGPHEKGETARMLSRLFEHAGSVDLRQVVARIARHRADRWAAKLVEAVRDGTHSPPRGNALAVVASWRDTTGALLPPKVAAVELLNILRPFVAISAYLTFAAHALATRPEERAALRSDPDRLFGFVQEVRRTYPFFPALVARARVRTVWREHAIPAGRLVAFDIWGTNRDPAAWDDPDAFRPVRFRDWQGDPFTLIPQGGGAHATNHRCPGEWVTEDLMLAATRTLLDRVDWSALPPQDLSLDMRDLPGLPRDRLRLST
ncbi:cytochrome P450 [uncultured Jannaschia sp.]|uniref:cytochrome P450 n=1 Tax=uncultured Jannaschia sp. TaxID=293347 RepID=UPI00260EA5A8|nr:cytochrome P450 [uncultured Jannaschia sp.]